MLGILKKDLNLMISDNKNRLFYLLYIPLLFLIVDSYEPKWMYLVILYTYTYLTSITSFWHDISNKTSYMINSLPISRKEIVIYRYVSTFFYFLMTIVYVGIYLWIINILGIANVDYFNLEMIKISIPIILISTSIVYPAYFRFEPRLAQIIHLFMFITFFIGVMNVGYLGKKSLVDNLKFLSNGKYILLISIFLYLLSLLLSIRIYETKDL
ncbi:ABC-2 transporter permease [Anaerosalibacter massiliensis]|uniref:ABC-2 transporter permease n=1 Tax=Anaerosalibacter massiliensis TaxID=1347392 RepID=A0A9X2MI77_9FIRM|nr:ABC-2 transporter permease [Anaerosalibacter massiliensis]MCR2043647.1 ABC-2 transporter permease [Anaerosalibacter massiliensis]